MSVEKYKKEAEQKGVDTIIILTKKYGLTNFPTEKMVREAMIEAFQQGTIIGFEIARKIVSEKPKKELPF